MATPRFGFVLDADGTINWGATLRNNFSALETLGALASEHYTKTAADARYPLLTTARKSQLSAEFSVAANELTVSVNPCVVDFRSATLTTGLPNTRTLAAAASVVVPNGATLGTTNGVQARLIVGLLDNAGTLETFIINQSGGVNLDGSGVISTTAISTGADSANVAYSTTARTNVPYVIVGACDITEATAGTWATDRSAVITSAALASMGSYGFGQTAQILTGSRSFGTTYYNTTGKIIRVSVCLNNASSMTVSCYINGVANIVCLCNAGSSVAQYTFDVAPGESYAVNYVGGTANNVLWSERR